MDNEIRMRRYQDRNDNFNRRNNSKQKYRANDTKTEWENGRRREQRRRSKSSELRSISYIENCEKRLSRIKDLINSDTSFKKDFQEKIHKNEHILTKTAHSTKPANGRNLLNQRFLDEHHDTSTLYCYPLGPIGTQHDYKTSITKYEHYHHRKGEHGSLETLPDTRKDQNMSNPIRNKQENCTSMQTKNMPLLSRNREMYYKEDPGYAKQNEYYPKVRHQDKNYYAHNYHREGENSSFKKYSDNENIDLIRNRQKTYERATQLHEPGHRVRYNENIKKNNFPHITKYNTSIEKTTEENTLQNSLQNRTHTQENYLKTDSCLKIQNARIQERHPKNGNYNEGSKMPLNQFKEFRNGYNIQTYDRGMTNVYNDESKTEISNVSSNQLEEEEEVMKSDTDDSLKEDTAITIYDPKVIQIAKLILDGFQKDKDLERKYRETINENNIQRRKNTDSRHHRTPKTNDTRTYQKIPTKRSENVYSVNRIVSQNIINYHGRRVQGFDKNPLQAADDSSISSVNEQNHRRSFDRMEGYQTKGYQASTSKTTSRRLLPRKYLEEQANKNKRHGKNPQSSSLREVSVQLENQLPLYDENAHLLGYLKEGTLIIGPSCPQSCDSSLNLSDQNSEPPCPFSICNKATQLKDVTNTPASARWTYGSNFTSSVRHQLVKAKFDRCPKCVNCTK